MALKKLPCLALAILLIGLSGCGEAPTPTEPSETKAEEEPEVKEINILFVGNSHTYSNDMPTKIFNEDPTELTFTGSQPEKYAPILLEAARKAVFETPEIPKQYITSSIGVG